MKKVLFLSLAASAVMASCSNEVLDSVVPQEPQAISFENPFLDKGTRANENDMNPKVNFTTFQVWGKKTATDQKDIFENVTVTYQEDYGKWTYSTAQQYWEDGTYQFAAYTDGNSKANVDPTFNPTGALLTFTDYEDVNGTKDLIVASATDEAGKTNRTNAVQLTFGHKLAKVYFSFTTDATNNQTLTITGLKIDNAKSIGTLTNATSIDGTWSAQKTEKAYSYLAEQETIEAAKNVYGSKETVGTPSKELYLIPQTTVGLKATINVKLTDNGGKSTTKELEVNLNPTTNEAITEWKANYVYNYKANITRKNITLGDPIEFEVTEVSGWKNTEGDVTVPEIQVP